MDTKKIILLVGALLVAAVSAFAMRALLSTGAAPAAQALPAPVQAAALEPEFKGPKVLVAQATLPIGTIISPEHVAFQAWPEDMVHKSFYVENPENEEHPQASIDDVVGKVVRVSIGAGQPLSAPSLVGPGESGFLAAALNPGMRAVTVPVDNITGVAGFIFPGDRVDMLLTHNIGGERGETEAMTDVRTLKVAETIARNVRVLAVDQRTNTMQSAPKSGRSVTFEVTPRLVEKIQVAKMLGKIQLSLRSIKDQKLALERAIASGEIRVGDDQTPAEDLAMEFAVTQLPDHSGTTYTTGGDVSRFALDQEGRTKIKKIREQAPDDRPIIRVRTGKATQKVKVDEEATLPGPSLSANANPLSDDGDADQAALMTRQMLQAARLAASSNSDGALR